MSAPEPAFTHKIIRSFTGPGEHVFKSGDMVDASAWRNVNQLVRLRYLEPLDPRGARGARGRPMPPVNKPDQKD